MSVFYAAKNIYVIIRPLEIHSSSLCYEGDIDARRYLTLIKSNKMLKRDKLNLNYGRGNRKN